MSSRPRIFFAPRCVSQFNVLLVLDRDNWGTFSLPSAFQVIINMQNVPKERERERKPIDFHKKWMLASFNGLSLEPVVKMSRDPVFSKGFFFFFFSFSLGFYIPEPARREGRFGWEGSVAPNYLSFLYFCLQTMGIVLLILIYYTFPSTFPPLSMFAYDPVKKREKKLVSVSAV